MKARIRFSEPALSQLDEILEFVARDAPTAARRLGTRVLQEIERLEHFPE